VADDKGAFDAAVNVRQPAADRRTRYPRGSTLGVGGAGRAGRRARQKRPDPRLPRDFVRVRPSDAVRAYVGGLALAVIWTPLGLALPRAPRR
jgi:hypothetical protein